MVGRLSGSALRWRDLWFPRTGSPCRSLSSSILYPAHRMGSQVEQTIVLRAEFKPGERRTPLPPFAAAELIAAGYKAFLPSRRD
jgi:hypothetical protein